MTRAVYSHSGVTFPFSRLTSCVFHWRRSTLADLPGHQRADVRALEVSSPLFLNSWRFGSDCRVQFRSGSAAVAYHGWSLRSVVIYRSALPMKVVVAACTLTIPFLLAVAGQTAPQTAARSPTAAASP